MAAEAEAAREARAKIIRSHGERTATKFLRDAAQVLNESKAGLQLRYLQTLNTIGTEKNTTIVFPVPIDLMGVFSAGSSDKKKKKPNTTDDIPSTAVAGSPRSPSARDPSLGEFSVSASVADLHEVAASLSSAASIKATPSSVSMPQLGRQAGGGLLRKRSRLRKTPSEKSVSFSFPPPPPAKASAERRRDDSDESEDVDLDYLLGLEAFEGLE